MSLVSETRSLVAGVVNLFATPLQASHYVELVNPVGFQKSITSRDQVVFVDESGEYITTDDLSEASRPGFRTPWLRRHQPQGPMRSMAVVVLDELREDAAEVPWSDDQQVIETLASGGSDPALREGVRVRSPDRGAHDLGTDRSPDIIEGPRELGVAVTDQVTHAASGLVQGRRRVAGLLGDPLAGGVRGDAAQVDPPGLHFDEEQHVYRVSHTVSTEKKSHATMPAACWARKDHQVLDTRRGAGSMPAARRMRRTDEPDTR